MTASKTKTLDDLRHAIDDTDDELVALFAKRFELVKEVAKFKKLHGLPAAIPSRVAEVVKRVRLEADAKGFSPETAEKLWRQLISDMIEFEEDQLK